MGNIILLILMWPLLLLIIGIFGAWYGNYDDIIDWWYNEIDTNRRNGLWYYKTHSAMQQRKRE